MISRDIVIGPNPTAVLARHDIYLLSKDYKHREKVRDPWDKDKLVRWASVAAGEEDKVFNDDIDLINWWLGDEAVVRTEKGEELLLWLSNNKGAFTHYKRGDIEQGDYLLSKNGDKVTSLLAGEFSWQSPMAGGVFINGEVLDRDRQPNYIKAMRIAREDAPGAHENAFQLIWGDVLGALPDDELMTIAVTNY